MATATKKNKTSSTAQKAPTCEVCPNYNQPSSSTTTSLNDGKDMLNLFTGYITENSSKLEDRVKKLEESQYNQQDVFGSIKKLSNISRIAVLLLLIVPFIQLIVCAAIVYGLGIQEELPNILTWFLGGLSIFSLIEIIYVPVRIFLIEKRMDDIEKIAKEK